MTADNQERSTEARSQGELACAMLLRLLASMGDPTAAQDAASEIARLAERPRHEISKSFQKSGGHGPPLVTADLVADAVAKHWAAVEKAAKAAADEAGKRRREAETVTAMMKRLRVQDLRRG